MPRSYASPVRTARAQETRRRILSSAQGLFLADGYPGTTIAAIARNAGVAPDTVYTVFESKVGLLKALLDVVISGDDDAVPLLARSGPQAMREETDPQRQLTMFASAVTEQLERIRPLDDILRGAAAVDREAAQLRADIQLRQRREAMRVVVGWVADRGPLRDGLTRDEAAAVVWTLTSPETHTMLRDVWAWSSRRYADWLRDTMVATLLP